MASSRLPFTAGRRTWLVPATGCRARKSHRLAAGGYTDTAAPSSSYFTRGGSRGGVGLVVAPTAAASQARCCLRSASSPPLAPPETGDHRVCWHLLGCWLPERWKGAACLPEAVPSAGCVCHGCFPATAVPDLSAPPSRGPG